MNRRSLALLVVALLPSSAVAQATRTWVSGVGDDANPCSRTAPCKTFAGAISKTAAGGEISVLDPGGFGAVTITKSITIDGSGTLGSILASGTNGISVNAGVNDVVVLRGLSINGASTGTNGVNVLSASHVRVENCIIFGFTLSGIRATAGGTVDVAGTTLANDAGAAITAGGTTVVTVNRSQLSLGGVGIAAAETAQVTARDTVITGFTTAGVMAADTSVVNVDGGLVAESLLGVQADAGATVRLSDVMLSHNGTGLSGNVASFGNNRIAAGNGADGSPATTVPLQ
jgi:hypothetical protein